MDKVQGEEGEMYDAGESHVEKEKVMKKWGDGQREVERKRMILTLIPKDCILEATSFPILPSPTMPSTFPYSSAPMNCKIVNKTLAHCPPLTSHGSAHFNDQSGLVTTE